MLSALVLASLLFVAQSYTISDDIRDNLSQRMLEGKSASNGAQQKQRHVLVLGIEGAGHHTIRSLTGGISSIVQKPYNKDMWVGKAGWPVSDSRLLEERVLGIESSPSQTVVYTEDSFPEGPVYGIGNHPDVFAFSQIRSIEPVLVFLQRDFSESILSAHARFAVEREKTPYLVQLQVAELLLSLLQSYHSALCRKPGEVDAEMQPGENPLRRVECHTLSYSKLCGQNTTQLQHLADIFRVPLSDLNTIEHPNANPTSNIGKSHRRLKEDSPARARHPRLRGHSVRASRAAQVGAGQAHRTLAQESTDTANGTELTWPRRAGGRNRPASPATQDAWRTRHLLERENYQGHQCRGGHVDDPLYATTKGFFTYKEHMFPALADTP
mmetsp:Transcript_3053/g.10990  ORF Transcript_3053/g.10990 Transcript_3053/m.10990 type:complete len:383 (+) Transcript_3053:74-1222(+)